MLPQLVAISAGTRAIPYSSLSLSLSLSLWRALHSYAWKANRFTCRRPKQIEGFGVPPRSISVSLPLARSLAPPQGPSVLVYQSASPREIAPDD